MAQTAKVDVIANDIANAETPDATAKQTQFVPMSPGVSIGAVIDSREKIDMATNLTELINARAAYQAAVEAMRTENENNKTLIATV
jgi:flagellar basal body rod protein FlgG